MKVNGLPTRSIWQVAGEPRVEIIDQSALPHAYRVKSLDSLDDAAHAIRTMQVRGAPLIGVTAAFGVALALSASPDDVAFERALAMLGSTRPTAVNLQWALLRMQQRLATVATKERASTAWREANAVADEDVAQCRAIGEHGLALLRTIVPRRGRLSVMTHCNAGWLATVDHGTALAPIYAAFEAGIDIHVWVSETRPRNQGLLTAWELGQHGIPHTVMADNAAGHLLARGEVDAVIVGADRVAANGDVANKIGTYLKALAAREANVPFYVAMPHTTIDFDCRTGADIPIEERDGDEVRVVHGQNDRESPARVRQLPRAEAVTNPGFDVTPARLVTRLITERGSCGSSHEGLADLYPHGRAALDEVSRASR